MVSIVVVTLYMAHGLVSEAGMAVEEIGSPDEISWSSLISRGNTGYNTIGSVSFNPCLLKQKKNMFIAW